MYVGAAYQYECSGSAGAAYGGDVTLRPSLRGGSGMLELGCSLQPFRHSPLNLDLQKIARGKLLYERRTW